MKIGELYDNKEKYNEFLNDLQSRMAEYSEQEIEDHIVDIKNDLVQKYQLEFDENYTQDDFWEDTSDFISESEALDAKAQEEQEVNTAGSDQVIEGEDDPEPEVYEPTLVQKMYADVAEKTSKEIAGKLIQLNFYSNAFSLLLGDTEEDKLEKRSLLETIAQNIGVNLDNPNLGDTVESIVNGAIPMTDEEFSANYSWHDYEKDLKGTEFEASVSDKNATNNLKIFEETMYKKVASNEEIMEQDQSIIDKGAMVDKYLSDIENKIAEEERLEEQGRLEYQENLRKAEKEKEMLQKLEAGEAAIDNYIANNTQHQVESMLDPSKGGMYSRYLNWGRQLEHDSNAQVDGNLHDHVNITVLNGVQGAIDKEMLGYIRIMDGYSDIVAWEAYRNPDESMESIQARVDQSFRNKINDRALAIIDNSEPAIGDNWLGDRTPNEYLDLEDEMYKRMDRDTLYKDPVYKYIDALRDKALVNERIESIRKAVNNQIQQAKGEAADTLKNDQDYQIYLGVAANAVDELQEDEAGKAFTDANRNISDKIARNLSDNIYNRIGEKDLELLAGAENKSINEVKADIYSAIEEDVFGQLMGLDYKEDNPDMHEDIINDYSSMLHKVPSGTDDMVYKHVMNAIEKKRQRQTQTQNIIASDIMDAQDEPVEDTPETQPLENQQNHHPHHPHHPEGIPIPPEKQDDQKEAEQKEAESKETQTNEDGQNSDTSTEKPVTDEHSQLDGRDSFEEPTGGFNLGKIMAEEEAKEAAQNALNEQQNPPQNTEPVNNEQPQNTEPANNEQPQNTEPVNNEQPQDTELDEMKHELDLLNQKLDSLEEDARTEDERLNRIDGIVSIIQGKQNAKAKEKAVTDRIKQEIEQRHGVVNAMEAAKASLDAAGQVEEQNLEGLKQGSKEFIEANYGLRRIKNSAEVIANRLASERQELEPLVNTLTRLQMRAASGDKSKVSYDEIMKYRQQQVQKIEGLRREENVLLDQIMGLEDRINNYKPQQVQAAQTEAKPVEVAETKPVESKSVESKPEAKPLDTIEEVDAKLEEDLRPLETIEEVDEALEEDPRPLETIEEVDEALEEDPRPLETIEEVDEALEEDPRPLETIEEVDEALEEDPRPLETIEEVDESLEEDPRPLDTIEEVDEALEEDPRPLETIEEVDEALEEDPRPLETIEEVDEVLEEDPRPLETIEEVDESLEEDPRPLDTIEEVDESLEEDPRPLETIEEVDEALEEDPRPLETIEEVDEALEEDPRPLETIEEVDEALEEDPRPLDTIEEVDEALEEDPRPLETIEEVDEALEEDPRPLDTIEEVDEALEEDPRPLETIEEVDEALEEDPRPLETIEEVDEALEEDPRPLETIEEVDEALEEDPRPLETIEEVDEALEEDPRPLETIEEVDASLEDDSTGDDTDDDFDYDSLSEEQKRSLDEELNRLQQEIDFENLLNLNDEVPDYEDLSPEEQRAIDEELNRLQQEIAFENLLNLGSEVPDGDYNEVTAEEKIKMDAKLNELNKEVVNENQLETIEEVDEALEDDLMGDGTDDDFDYDSLSEEQKRSLDEELNRLQQEIDFENLLNLNDEVPDYEDLSPEEQRAIDEELNRLQQEIAFENLLNLGSEVPDGNYNEVTAEEKIKMDAKLNELNKEVVNENQLETIEEVDASLEEDPRPLETIEEVDEALEEDPRPLETIEEVDEALEEDPRPLETIEEVDEALEEEVEQKQEDIVDINAMPEQMVDINATPEQMVDINAMPEQTVDINATPEQTIDINATPEMKKVDGRPVINENADAEVDYDEVTALEKMKMDAALNKLNKEVVNENQLETVPEVDEALEEDPRPLETIEEVDEALEEDVEQQVVDINALGPIKSQEEMDQVLKGQRPLTREEALDEREKALNEREKKLEQIEKKLSEIEKKLAAYDKQQSEPEKKNAGFEIQQADAFSILGENKDAQAKDVKAGENKDAQKGEEKAPKENQPMKLKPQAPSTKFQGETQAQDMDVSQIHEGLKALYDELNKKDSAVIRSSKEFKTMKADFKEMLDYMDRVNKRNKENHIPKDTFTEAQQKSLKAKMARLKQYSTDYLNMKGREYGEKGKLSKYAMDRIDIVEKIRNQLTMDRATIRKNLNERIPKPAFALNDSFKKMKQDIAKKMEPNVADKNNPTIQNKFEPEISVEDRWWYAKEENEGDQIQNDANNPKPSREELIENAKKMLREKLENQTLDDATKGKKNLAEIMNCKMKLSALEHYSNRVPEAALKYLLDENKFNKDTEMFMNSPGFNQFYGHCSMRALKSAVKGPDKLNWQDKLYSAGVQSLNKYKLEEKNKQLEQALQKQGYSPKQIKEYMANQEKAQKEAEKKFAQEAKVMSNNQAVQNQINQNQQQMDMNVPGNF